MNTPKIITRYICPPIPTRQFDWCATTDNYEGGDGYDERPGPAGYGATEEEAIADLRDLLEDLDHA